MLVSFHNGAHLRPRLLFFPAPPPNAAGSGQSREDSAPPPAGHACWAFGSPPPAANPGGSCPAREGLWRLREDPPTTTLQAPARPSCFAWGCLGPSPARPCPVTFRCVPGHGHQFVAGEAHVGGDQVGGELVRLQLDPVVVTGDRFLGEGGGFAPARRGPPAHLCGCLPHPGRHG